MVMAYPNAFLCPTDGRMDGRMGSWTVHEQMTSFLMEVHGTDGRKIVGQADETFSDRRTEIPEGRLAPVTHNFPRGLLSGAGVRS